MDDQVVVAPVHKVTFGEIKMGHWKRFELQSRVITEVQITENKPFGYKLTFPTGWKDETTYAVPWIPGVKLNAENWAQKLVEHYQSETLTAHRELGHIDFTLTIGDQQYFVATDIPSAASLDLTDQAMSLMGEKDFKVAITAAGMMVSTLDNKDWLCLFKNPLDLGERFEIYQRSTPWSYAARLPGRLQHSPELPIQGGMVGHLNVVESKDRTVAFTFDATPHKILISEIDGRGGDTVTEIVRRKLDSITSTFIDSDHSPKEYTRLLKRLYRLKTLQIDLQRIHTKMLGI